MADDKGKGPKGTTSTGKRPFATLDLRATEIKVTPVAGKPAQASSAASSSATSNAAEDVPRPSPARFYATAASADANSSSEAPMGAQASSSDTTNATASTDAEPGRTTNVVVHKRGGFFSHLAAGIVGGIVAFAAGQTALPQLAGWRGPSAPTDNTSALSDRVAALEKTTATPQTTTAPNLTAVEGRLASLEKSVQTIPELTDSQKRLVAETKAALASAASDAGSPQLIERLGKLEDKFKALADAGAGDPNAGRVEQLAALTGKVTDLETQLGTALSALRASVSKDVDTRVQAASEASQAAKAGTERIEKDVATVKSDTARIEARVVAAKDQVDHVAADLNLVQEGSAELKTGFEALKAAAAKPGDISSAIAPVADRIATLEKSVQQVVQDDGARKENAERVVLALELQNLRRALDSGQKFSAELEAVKKSAGNSVDLSPLTQLQESGVPSLADLNKDFHAAADSAIDADSDTQGGGVVDKLWAGAKSVVRVRRIDAQPDDKSTEATVGRMQVALNDGRLADALENAKDLSAKARDAARPFLDKLAARVSVDTALANLEAQLKSSIAPGSAAQPKPQP